MSVKKIQDKIWSSSTSDYQLNYYYTFKPAVDRSKWFADVLKNYDFKSIYETGVYAGRNLKYIRDQFPEVKIGGLDINKVALDFARSKVSDVDLVCCDIYEMDVEEKWDIVFTMGVLIHIVPDSLEKVIQKCINKSNKYVFHIEGQGGNKVLSGPAQLKPKKVKDKFQWEPDIMSVYKKLGIKASIVELPDDLKTYGASHCITVDLTKQ